MHSSSLNSAETEFFIEALRLLLLQTCRFAIDSELTERDYNSPTRLAGDRGTLFDHMHISAYGRAADILYSHSIAADGPEHYCEVKISASEISREVLKGPISLAQLVHVLIAIAKCEEQSEFTLGELAPPPRIEAFQRAGLNAGLLTEVVLDRPAVDFISQRVENADQSPVQCLLLYSGRMPGEYSSEITGPALPDPNCWVSRGASLFELAQTCGLERSAQIIEASVVPDEQATEAPVQFFQTRQVDASWDP